MSDSEGKVRLFHQNGSEVLLPIPTGYAQASEKINEYVKQGWLVRQPDPQYEQIIGYVAKRARIDERSGEEVPILDLYGAHDGMSKRFIVRYINTDQQHLEFTAATGLTLDDIPMWEGEQPLERGKGNAHKYIVKLNQPVKIIYKNNPKYPKDKADSEKTQDEKKIPARLFVAWGEPVEFEGWVSENRPNAPKNEEKKSTPTTKKPSAGSANGHWAENEVNRQKVKDTFIEYGIDTVEKMVQAMGEIEEGVTKLSQSKVENVDRYCHLIKQMYEAW